MRYLLLALSSLALVGVCAPGAPAPSPATAETLAHADYGLEVTLAPSPSAPGSVEYKVVVTDLVSGKTVAAPRATTRLGVDAQVASSTTDGSSVRGTMKVSEDGTTAAYAVSVTRNGALVAKHAGTVSLNP